MTPAPFAAGHALLWAAAAAFFVWLGLAAAAAVAPGTLRDAAMVGAIEVAAVLGTAALVLRAHGPARPLTELAALRSTHPALVVSGGALGILLHPVCAALQESVERIAPTPAADLARRAVWFDFTSPVRMAGVVFVVACLVPLAEELFVRGVLFGLLVPTSGRLEAAGVTGVAFLLLHWLSWRSAPTLLVSAAVLGFLRAISGSLLPGVGLHVTFNATALMGFASGLVTATRPYSPTAAWWGASAFGCLGLLGLAAWIGAYAPAAAVARKGDGP